MLSHCQAVACFENTARLFAYALIILGRCDAASKADVMAMLRRHQAENAAWLFRGPAREDPLSSGGRRKAAAAAAWTHSPACSAPGALALAFARRLGAAAGFASARRSVASVVTCAVSKDSVASTAPEARKNPRFCKQGLSLGLLGRVRDLQHQGAQERHGFRGRSGVLFKLLQLRLLPEACVAFWSPCLPSRPSLLRPKRPAPGSPLPLA